MFIVLCDEIFRCHNKPFRLVTRAWKRHAFYCPLTWCIPHLVLLRARSETELEGIAARLDRLKIQYQPFYEPDLANQLTSLATEPLSAARRKPLRRYACWPG